MSGPEPQAWLYRLRGWVTSGTTLDETGLLNAILLVADDIHAWMEESVTRWDIVSTEMRSDDLEACWTQVYFRFHDKAQAALFVLRWGGDERIEG